jgi:16S rRNA (guanine527-N7)-methyltransferase
MSAAEALASGLTQLGLALPCDGQRKLVDYLRLLDQWNRVYNLSAIRSEAVAVSVHLLDSLVLLKVMPEVATVDVGSGAGLPGVPLAIARPRSPVSMIESNGKKAAFVRHAVARLALDNADVVEERVEHWRPQRRFPAIVSRAFAELAEFVRVSAHLLAPGGRFYAMKGRADRAELDALPSPWQVIEVRPFAVPGVEGQRHVVVVGEAGS